MRIFRISTGWNGSLKFRQDGGRKMKISTKGRYAIRIMLDLAVNNNGEYIPLKDISQRQGISLKYLEQIISRLNKAGYLKSFRGSSGGYRLAKMPCEYTIGDILRTTEGSMAPISCLENGAAVCEKSGSCSTLSFWQGLDRAINNYIDSVSLEDLLKNELRLNMDKYIT